MRQFALILCLMTAPFAAMAKDAVNLAPRFTVGQNLEYSTLLECKVDQKLYPPCEMDMSYLAFLGLDTKINVVNISEDLSTSLQITLVNPQIRFSLKGAAAGGFNFNMDFDSTKNDETPNNPLQFLAQVADCLDDVQFFVVVDANGQVSEVTGLDSINEKIDTVCGVLISNEIKDQISTFVDSEIPTQFIGTLTSYIPEHSVHVGDNWKKTFDFLPGYEENWIFSNDQGNTLVLKNEQIFTKENLEGVLDAFSSEIHEFDGTLSDIVELEKGTHILSSARGEVEYESEQTVSEPVSMKSDSKIKLNFLIKRTCR